MPCPIPPSRSPQPSQAAISTPNSADRPPANLQSTRIRARTVASLTSSPPSAILASSIGGFGLSWNAPDDDSVTGYQILRRSPTLGEEKLLIYVNNTNTTATEYTDSNVVPNERYAYRVKAINAAGLSGRSDFVTVTPM